MQAHGNIAGRDEHSSPPAKEVAVRGFQGSLVFVFWGFPLLVSFSSIPWANFPYLSLFCGRVFSSWVLPAGENFWFEFFWGVVFPLFFFLLLFFSLLSPPLLFPKGDGEGGKKRGMGIGKKGQDEGVGQRKKQMRNKISDSDATAREASP